MQSQLGLGFDPMMVQSVKFFMELDNFTNSSVSTIALGLTHAFALTSASELFGWGSNEAGQLASDSVYESKPIQVGFFRGKKII